MNTTAMSLVQFIVLTPFHAGGLALQPGAPFFSSHTAAQRFLPLLRELGDVIEANDITTLTPLVQRATHRGFQPLLVCFMPPHLLPQTFPCPVLLMFSWGYDTIPDDAWGSDARNDWRRVLPSCAGVAMTSGYALQAVERAITLNLPAAVIPAPVPAAFFDLFCSDATPSSSDSWQLSFDGVAIDSHALGLDRSHHSDTPSFAVSSHTVTFRGVVYTVVVDPINNSKNWLDSLWVFGFGFRDNPDVTLIVKLSHYDTQRVCDLLLYEMRKMAPYKCRIVTISTWLDEPQMLQLVRGSSFIISSAHAAGQGHALLEFMAAGKPVVGPRHTAMDDYLDEENAFIADCSREWIHWPHDPRLMLRTRRFRLNWTSYRDALLRSHDCIARQPDTYRHLSQHAHASAQAHATQDNARAQLRDFIDSALRHARLPALRPPVPTLATRLRGRLRALLGRPPA